MGPNQDVFINSGNLLEHKSPTLHTNTHRLPHTSYTSRLNKHSCVFITALVTSQSFHSLWISLSSHSLDAHLEYFSHRESSCDQDFTSLLKSKFIGSRGQSEWRQHKPSVTPDSAEDLFCSRQWFSERLLNSSRSVNVWRNWCGRREIKHSGTVHLLRHTDPSLGI